MVHTRRILLVDDEENILSSLARLLRRDGYEIFRADGGAKGLEVLAETEGVGVIISDQRMPEMTGVEFLSKVKVLYPDTVRIVLSGYTDLNSVTDAINEGSIYKFLTKPWDDALLRENVAKAFSDYELKLENLRLTNELQEANRELADINKDLESRVEQKTREVMINMKTLEVSQEVLEHLPLAVVGVAEDTMVAIANSKARSLLANKGDHVLIGGFASEFLSEEVDLQAVDGKNGKTVKVNHYLGDQAVSFCISRFGKLADARGWIIVIHELLQR